MSALETAHDALERIHEVTAATEITGEERMRRFLAVGADSLDLPIGYFTHITDGKQQIIAAVGDHDDIEAGAVDPIGETYCRKAVDREQPLILTDAENEGWEDDPAFERFGLRCYLGSRVEVDGTVYGTICFADERPRPDIDTNVLQTVIDLLAQIIGYELEREQYEQKLEYREKKYRHLFEESRDALLLLDRTGVIECNDAAVNLFEADSRAALVEHSLEELSLGFARDHVTADVTRAEQSKQRNGSHKRRFQRTLERTGGSTFEAEVQLSRIDISGDPFVLALVRDVTEELARERHLHLFRRAVEQASHSVFITERDGSIVYVNPAFESQTGYSREEALGQTPAMLKSGKQPDSFYEQLWETVLSGETWEADIVNRRRSGELYKVRQEITPITNEAGEITHFVALQSDVTERRLREQQLAVLNRVLRHNLRNGVAVIGTQMHTLGEHCECDACQQPLAQIHERVAELSKLSEKTKTVRQLFDHSDTPRDCSVNGIIEPVLTAFQKEHRDVSVRTDVADGLHIRCDSRLQVALEELLENAVVHNDKPEPKIEITADRFNQGVDSQWVKIAIADNGPGIPDHEREPLERGNETDLQHTSGIDLWVVYWAISLLGGELTIEDRLEHGSRVVITLPAASAKKDRQLACAGENG